MPALAGQEGAAVPAASSQPSMPRATASQAPPLPSPLETGLLKTLMPKGRYGASATVTGTPASHHLLCGVCVFPTGRFHRHLPGSSHLNLKRVWRRAHSTEGSHSSVLSLLCKSLACFPPQAHVPEHHCNSEFCQEGCGVQQQSPE